MVRQSDSLMTASPSLEHWPLIIIGTGFAGLSLALQRMNDGQEDFIVLEQAQSPGGTWRDNRYPGCACDVPSHLYSLSCAPPWDWQRKYAEAPEIEAYLAHLAHSLGARIRYRSRVRSAAWQAREQLWQVELDDGSRLTCRFLVAGVGPLSEPAWPDLPGLENFAGPLLHTARWPRDRDLKGQRVGLIGTGASAIQVGPALAPKVAQLVIFQRTAPWVVARKDHPYATGTRRLLGKLPCLRRAYRAWLYLTRELKGLAFLWPGLMRRIEKGVRRDLAHQVSNPQLRQKIMPRTPMGCKRILLSDTWWSTLELPHVTLETDPIHHIEAAHLVTETGARYALDALVLATGFRYQDNPMARLFKGENGLTLEDFWKAQRSAYLGMMMPSFPNFFLLTGPFSGLGHNSIVFMIECQTRWIQSALAHVAAQGKNEFKVRAQAYATFTEEMNQRSKKTLWMQGCQSWYLDPAGRNTALWPGFSLSYWWRTRHFDAKDFDYA